MDMKTETNVDTKVLKVEIEYIKEAINEMKVDLKQALKTINESMPAVRRDVNLANERTVENRIRLDEHDERISSLELKDNSANTALQIAKYFLPSGMLLGIIELLRNSGLL